MNKYKKIAILLSLLISLLTVPKNKSVANNCPELAKKYIAYYGNSPIGSGAVSSFHPGKLLKVQRLTSNQYLLGNDLIITKDCSTITFTDTRTGNFACNEGGETFTTNVNFKCDGFLKSNKVFAGSCVINFSLSCGDFQDAISFKYRPVK